MPKMEPTAQGVGTHLTSYMVSNMQQTKGLLLNVIKQPLYDSNTIDPAAPATELTYFQTPVGQSNLARTNMVNAGSLALPKAFFIRGVRIDILQTMANQEDPAVFVGLIDGTLVEEKVFNAILENYVFRGVVGDKKFLEVPARYLPSGLGSVLMVAGEGLAKDPGVFGYTSTNGQPIHDNYFKIPQDLEVVIPPLQSFSAQLINATGITNLGAGAKRIVQIYFEGALARETQ